MATRLTANTVAHPNPLPMGEGRTFAAMTVQPNFITL
jgi:hypothetical protein